jgi:hypothetical protein
MNFAKRFMAFSKYKNLFTAVVLERHVMKLSFKTIKINQKANYFFRQDLTANAIAIFLCMLAAQLFFLASVARAQTIFEREKQNWMERDGRLLDGGFNLAFSFLVWFANGTQDQHYGDVQKAINELLNGESWYGGNRSYGVIAAQLYFWYGDKLSAADREKVRLRLEGLVEDKNYFGIGNSNTGMNCMTARYLMAQHDKTAQVVYNVPDNIYGPPNFTYNGRSYRRGGTYSSYELARDWLYYWFDLVLEADYIHGELFSEIYSIHFINCLTTLADSRMVQDPEMRKRAKLLTDFFLLEHVVNTNGHHLAAPLGRSYMQLHRDGSLHFFYWDYWGQMRPTWYGHPDGPFLSEYRLTPLLEDLGRYDDEPGDYWHLLRASVQGERNVLVTKDYTLGSNPDDGGWMLEINSNDPGPYPQARPGFPFRIWMNEYADDLNPSACSGECYSQMGTHAHQYKNAMLVKLGSARLHEALTSNKWDIVENHNSGWRFSQEARVAVAILRGGSSAALEVARIGIDYPSFEAFKSAVLSRASLEENVFVTSKGDRIEARYNAVTKSLETYVNGQDSWRYPLPRLEVVTNRGEKTVEWQNRVMTVRKHGRTAIYDFNRWTYREASGGTDVDINPPKAPAGFKVSQ